MYWTLIWSPAILSIDAVLAKVLASAFCSLAIYWNWVVMKPLIHCLTLFKYFFICSSLASHGSFIWPITNCESYWTRTEFAPSDLAYSKPWSRASYSSSLLVAWNCRRTTYSRWSASSNCKTIIIPHACCVDEPSTWMTYCFALWSSFCWLLVGVNSEMKSARTWAFIAFPSLYCTSNSLSSTAHWINCPVASNLIMAFFSRWFIRTLITWAWKLGLSFLVAITNENANFFISGYHPLIPLKALLLL